MYGKSAVSVATLSATRPLANAAKLSRDKLLTLPVSAIRPDPDAPREEFARDELRQLGESMRDRGQLQPVIVCRDRGGYLLVVGERRRRAAIEAGLETIEAIQISHKPSASELLELRLIENCTREGLKPIEQARAYRALMDDRGWSLRRIATELHVHFTGVQKSLALLNLPESVQQSVDDGSLTASAAQTIAASIKGPAEQIEFASRVVTEGLSRDNVVEQARQKKTFKPRRMLTVSSRSWTIRLPSGSKVQVESANNRLDQAEVISALKEALRIARKSPDFARS